MANIQDKLVKLIQSTNIAEDLDDNILLKIGQDARTAFDNDLSSRVDWETAVEKWVETATLIAKEKTYPWPKASNVKYPLVATAAMQFSARAYPSLIPPVGDLVKTEVIGKDPDNQLEKAGKRISNHMTYQLRHEIEDWEENMDKLFLNLAIVGTAFKKTYWKEDDNLPCSELILAKDLVVNFWAKNIKNARTSEIIYLTENDVEEHVRSGKFLENDYSKPVMADIGKLHKAKDIHGNAPDNADESTPYVFIEQHTWLDLDEDGYKEPYIVTFEHASTRVASIIARYDSKGISFTNDKKVRVKKIKPINYYVKYGFIPSFNGGFYDLGFGQLLGPLNASADTLLNQIIDSGTIYNLQSGFLAKGLSMQSGTQAFTPGEWKVVNTMMDDLKKGIVPLPVREPSKVLFELLGLIVQSGKELASVAEIMVGKMPGQNTPATTTQTAVEEGMRLFTAIYKRIYRSLTQEFTNLYRLNSIYLGEQVEGTILNDPELLQMQEDDYSQEQLRIRPSADPSVASQAQKLAKAQALLPLVQSGRVNVDEVILRILDAQEQPNVEKLIKQEPPGPSPEQQQAQAEMQMKQQEAQMKAELEQQKAQMKMQADQMKMEIESMKAANKIATEKQMAELKLVTARMEAQLKLQEANLKHQQSMRQMSEQMNMERTSNAIKLETEKRASDAKIENMKKEASAKKSTKKTIKRTKDGYEVSDS